ncbi:MAG: FtsX-like permease family protein [Bacteroidota bacterium]
MKLLPKILWQQQNRWQIVAASVGAFLGLFLLLMAVQLQQDIRHLMKGPGDGKTQYIIINKQVNLLNTLGLKASFSEAEIEELRTQSFVEEVGTFTANRFKVSASSRSLGFYTELFFESVPDQFLDTDTDFDWEEGQPDLPVIMSRDYLALYNFGFAPSQGLPQFTPGTIQRVSLDVTLRGNGQRQTFSGSIAGFSDRINSILVPQNFMDWANKKFGSGSAKAASRLIVATPNPNAKVLLDYLEDHAYEVSSGKIIGGQLATVLRGVVGILAFIGFVIVLLSLLVFLLNFQLIIAQARRDIGLLLQLGHPPRRISDLLIRRVLRLFALTFVAALIALFVARYLMVEWFDGQGLYLPKGVHWSVLLTALAVAAIFTFVNIRSIRQRVIRLF